jgi:membrane-associated phospholipid phosphatase
MNTKQIAKIISYIFIPPLMNFIIFILLTVKVEVPEKRFWVIGTAFIFGLLFPIVTFIILRKKGKIVNDDATIKEERTIPYLYGILFSIIATVILFLNNANILAVLLWFSYLFNSIILIIVNKYWKISAHAMGVAIPLAASFFICDTFIYVLFFILLLVAWARYELKVHTVPQIISGAIVGFSITFILLSNNTLLN